MSNVLVFVAPLVKVDVTVIVTGCVAHVVVALILVLEHVNPIVLVPPMQVEQNLIFLK